jgi:acetyl-CoA carboxylase biotin carboxyl carrier protein
MDYKEITDLLKLVNKTDLTEVLIEQSDFKIKIKRGAPESNVFYTQAQPAMAAPVSLPSAAPTSTGAAPKPDSPQEDASAPENTVVFRSPMIGTFYRSASPENPPFVKVGDEISKGQVVCIIEAMKLFNEIESEFEGKIVKMFVEDAQPVEYDQELFLIELKS